MMEEHAQILVRTPQEPERPVEATVEPQEVNEMTSSDTRNPSPEELVKLGRPPYITDLLEARPAYETFEIESQLKAIDVYIRDGIEDDETAYKAALSGLKQHIKETDDIYSTVEQLYEYVSIQNKIKEVIREQKEFEAKSPEDMTADQLRRYFKEKEQSGLR